MGKRGEYFEHTDLWAAGKGEYHTYRIPAMVVTTKGSILAFCEGRKFHSHDAGKIDLLVKRSHDHGQSWEEERIAVEDRDMTCGNPCPVVDRSDGTIWLPFCKNERDDQGTDAIFQGKAERTVWITSSRDEGQTWAEPVEITAAAKDPSWTWFATGPGHGIQLSSGRLVIPCDHGRLNGDRPGPDETPPAFDEASYIFHGHAMLSDDGGGSWRIGGIVGEGTNESAVVETADGAVYINCRNKRNPSWAPYRRARAWSYDGGESFGEVGREEAMVEPPCQGSLVRCTREGVQDRNRILFANPACTEGPEGGHGGRRRLTVRLTYDECHTWPVSRLIHDGPSAYSDLAVAPDGTINCLYERSEKGSPSAQLALARFNLEWLTQGEDQLIPPV